MAVVQQAEIVACTLSAAGGDLASLLSAGPMFNVLIIDEVSDAVASLIFCPCWSFQVLTGDNHELLQTWACFCARLVLFLRIQSESMGMNSM